MSKSNYWKNIAFPNDVVDLRSVGSDGIIIPQGTTAERPVSPITGTMRFNTTTQRAETYIDGTGWVTDDSSTHAAQTATNAAATAADAAQTAADAAQTAADAAQTAADAVSTGISEGNAATNAVRSQQWAEGVNPPDNGDSESKSAKTWASMTAADRVQTGLDRVQTSLDRVATAADRDAAEVASNSATSAAAVTNQPPFGVAFIADGTTKSITIPGNYTDPAQIDLYVGAVSQCNVDDGVAGTVAFTVTIVGADTRIDWLGNDRTGTQNFPAGTVVWLNATRKNDVTYTATSLADGSAGSPSLNFTADPDTGIHRPAANQIGFTTGGARRVLLSTAALQLDVPLTGTAVTQTKADTTVGRLLKVGDFGVGGLALSAISLGVNLDAVDNSIPTGVYGVVSTDWTGSPTPTGWYHVVHTRRASGGGESQVALKETTDEVYFRSRSSGAWSTWYRHLTTNRVQTSTTDAVAGRLMGVGAFGLGETDTFPTVLTAAGSADLNALTKTGWSRYSSSTDANSPSDFGTVLHMARASSSAFGGLMQLGFSHGGKVYIRHNNSVAPVTYNNWAEIFSARTVLGAVTQAGGVPTGALIERGSNANGTYTRFADGTMICSVRMIASAVAGVDWTFPSAFSAAPVVTGNAEASVLSAVTLAAQPGLTSVTFSARDQTDARRADFVNLIARGRWF